MRTFSLGLVCLSLAACDSGQVPSPADRLAGDVPLDVVEKGFVTLHGEGLVAGAERFFFAAGRNEVETAVINVLGEPTGRAEIEECGAGPVAITSFPGELKMNFQQGSLVGWNVGTTSVGEAANIKVDGDVTIGMVKDRLASVSGYTPIEGSTLGEEFALSDTMGGFVEKGAVSMLYAGTQCFFR